MGQALRAYAPPPLPLCPEKKEERRGEKEGPEERGRMSSGHSDLITIHDEIDPNCKSNALKLSKFFGEKPPGPLLIPLLLSKACVRIHLC